MSELLVGLTEHITTDIYQDEYDFSYAECECGYRSVPVPDIETLVDEMMSHTSLAVQLALRAEEE